MAEAFPSGLLNRVDPLEGPGAPKRPSGPSSLPASGRHSLLAARVGPKIYGFSARRRPKPYPMGLEIGSSFRPSPRLFSEPLGRSLAAETAPRGVKRCGREVGSGGNQDREEAGKEPRRRGIGSLHPKGV